MCTLTWLLNDNGYEVFFNRDEQRSRPKAKLPVYDTVSESIFPIDPGPIDSVIDPDPINPGQIVSRGKGTWIGVNKKGLSLCLLNNYQDGIKAGNGDNFTSRGVLIPKLIHLNTPENIIAALGEINLKVFQPFSLCIFPANLSIKNNRVFTWSWNGEVSTEGIAGQPVISSAVLLENVTRSRTDLFKQLGPQENITDDSLLSYHSSHKPEKGKFSVCMHRDDARTQSLSHIQVGKNISFGYHDGPPCKNNKWTKLFMPE